MSALGMSLLFVGVSAMHSHFLSSKLASTCTYLYPGILQVCYISLASAYDGEYRRSGEMLNNIALRSCWQSALSIFQISTLPLPPAAADCRAVTATSSASSSHRQRDFFCSIELTPAHIVLLEWPRCCCCDFPAINTDITAF